MFINFYMKYCLILFLAQVSFAQVTRSAQNLVLECTSASNDWVVHIDATAAELMIYSTSTWSLSKKYYRGAFSLSESDYRLKDFAYVQRCHEVKDSKNIMKLKFCVFTEDGFYAQKEVQSEEHIQSKYTSGYYFGMGEIEFFITPAPIVSGTLFHCFEKKELESFF